MAQNLAKKREHTGPAEKNRVTLVPHRERAVGKYARAAFVNMKRIKAVSRKHQIVRRAFSVRKVKRSAAEERDEYSSAEEQ